MQRRYPPLPAQRLEPDATFHRPPLPEAKAVGLEDPALDVMTDFRRVRAITVPASATMDYADGRMRANRVHLLLVVDDRNCVLGLITSTDIGGDKPVRLVHDRGLRREEITVADVMTPRERLEVIGIEDLTHAHVGHVLATLKAAGRQHAMVVDHDALGRQCVRGLLSASQLSRQLGTPVQPVEIARNFAEVETALAHG
jgi:CBS domain containing-hemolysin-like protein